ncbi:cation:proton antiporter [Nocardioides sp.]|uniref:cation:proton antiporter n=1 Tax=Nocardioides sp. TaxID=35761 RepID=UPI0035282915
MEDTFLSLWWIALAGVAAPLVAHLVPRRLVPEVVILLGLGTLLGPHVLDLAETDNAVQLLHELGLAMLFLLAGFEIELGELTGRAGRRALGTWVTSLLFALGVVVLLDVSDVVDYEVAVAIAVTSTALGTLLPVLKDNRLLATRVGASVMRHGAYGELGPIVAMAVLLGARGPGLSLAILAAFALVAVVVALPSLRIRQGTWSLLQLVRAGAETTGQTPVRLTMLLLITLVTVAEVFHLDIVLGAFAAGFILRAALPEGDARLETRLEGIAFGLLVPLFFVTSGMTIDPAAIAAKPRAFVAAVLLILVARGAVVFLGQRTDRRDPMAGRPSASVGLFAATGLPIIVAVTSVSVAAGQMSTENASILVAAGAMTVLLCPPSAILVLGRHDAPADAQA